MALREAVPRNRTLTDEEPELMQEKSNCIG